MKGLAKFHPMKFSTKSTKFKPKKQRKENYTIEINGRLNYLFDEDLKRILTFLDIKDLINIHNVSTKFRDFIKHIDWKVFFEGNTNIIIKNTYSKPKETLDYFERCFIREKCFERCKESLYEYFLVNFEFQIEWKSEEEMLEFHKNVLIKVKNLENEKIYEFWSEDQLIFTLEIYGFYCEIIVPKNKVVIVKFDPEFGGDNQSLTFINEINRLSIK